MMEALGSEVSGKIRDAIKAKLIELSAYVDDELPDYIMVMVVNGKDGPQMKADLGLFLSHNTDVFVDWLVQVLDKLKKVALGDPEAKKKALKKKAKKEAKQEKKRKKKEKKAAKRERKGSEEPGEEFDDLNTSRESVPSSPPPPPRIRPGTPPPPPSMRNRHRSRSPQKRPSPPPRRRSRERVSQRRPSPRRLSPRRSSPRRDRERRDSSRDRRDARPRQPSTDRNRARDREREAGRRHSGPGTSRERDRSRRDRSYSPRSGMSSSIGAVISHDSDGEYNPEAMLKRSIVASTVTAPKRPDPPKPSSSGGRRAAAAGKELVLKAVADADRSIVRRQREGRQRDEELAAIHNKRMALSLAMKGGQLDEKKIEEINKTVKMKQERPETKERDRSPLKRRPERKEKRHSDGRKTKSVLEGKKMAADLEEDQKRKLRREQEKRSEKKTERTSKTMKQDELDLRHSLGAGKKSRGLDALRNSGLKICVANDGPSEEERRLPSPEKEVVDEYSPKHVLPSEASDFSRLHPAEEEDVVQEEVIEESEAEETEGEEDEQRAHHEDEYLEAMRRRALESMKRRRSGEELMLPKQSPKKIIIPLGEDSSDDDDDDEYSERGEGTMSSASGESEKKAPPTFIVTLGGIDKEYFKGGKGPVNSSNSIMNRAKKEPEATTPAATVKKQQATATSSAASLSAAPKPTAPVKGRARILPPSNIEKKKTGGDALKKPEAKVAPLVKAEEEKKPLRKRISFPEPDPVKIPVVSRPVAPLRTSASAPVLKSNVVPPGKTLCKFYPQCTRGASCFFYHPLQPRGPANTAKFKWTAAGAK